MDSKNVDSIEYEFSNDENLNVKLLTYDKSSIIQFYMVEETKTGKAERKIIIISKKETIFI